MPPLSGLVVNDRDLAAFGWQTETISGLTGVVAQRTPTTQLAGALGVAITTPDPEAGVRPLVCTGYVEGATNAALKANLQALLDHIARKSLPVHVRIGRQMRVVIANGPIHFA